MDVRILSDTVADRRMVYAGQVISLDRQEARVLIAMGKAELVALEDVTISDVEAAAQRMKARARKP